MSGKRVIQELGNLKQLTSGFRVSLLRSNRHMANRNRRTKCTYWCHPNLWLCTMGTPTNPTPLLPFG
jgi:hypothetical protein